MRFPCFVLVLSCSIIWESCAQTVKSSDCNPPDHSVWSALLQANVDENGGVNYQGFVNDSSKLNSYLAELSSCYPTDNWNKEEKLAYWINAYNAFTIKLILDYYPVQSIKDIKRGIPFVNSVWDIEFFKIGSAKMDLNEIEHSILRKEFDEPRIHFAIVCASKSCPRLLNEAYQPQQLEKQLELQARNFINDSTKNELIAKEIRVSSIFKWFKGDFTENGTLQMFIQKYSEQNILPNAKVSYLEYDWSLNGE